MTPVRPSPRTAAVDGGGGRGRGSGSGSGGVEEAVAGRAGSLAQLVAGMRGGPEARGRLRARIRRDRNLSAGYLGLGFNLFAVLLLIRGLASLGWSWGEGEWRWLSLVAWALLIVTFAASFLAARLRGGILPARLSLLVIGSGFAAMLLDLGAFLLDGGRGVYPTATIGFGACLIACLPRQPLRWSVVGTVVLTATGTGTVLVGWANDPQSLSTGVTGVLLGLAPVLAGVSMIQAADRYLGRTIDQAVTGSLVTAPALGHGVLAASELRRLDGDAERLLAGVAALPAGGAIDAETAASAAQLGDGLRLALLADHEQTWLQLAVSESEHLGDVVRIVDPSLLAARLGAEQRQLVLALVWLLVATAPPSAPALDLTLVPSRPGAGAPPAIAFALAGTHRRAIDPAVWPLFTRLGRHTIDLGTGRALVVVELA
ncbi:hypothetical protein [Herbiconiux sp. VKM Ac-2851]|uniref:hypothetical protein n=1 Tax=Herbiconiux sp. VKM Ac-2851 TaxID=2739025 RepID=UPI0015649673|nr:hypothetical protein [Herbiconiux sp. VKM Ac-2851]NQX34180.1 hypothetical protein [Herbiconiux sp. VKM Ac-2851]